MENSRIDILLTIALAIMLSSCSKKPAEYYREGMQEFTAGKYGVAQETFAKGIKHGGNDSLYAGFVASNLVTGKYPQVNVAYNGLSAGIRRHLTDLYGQRTLGIIGITSDIIPYNTSGKNRIPSDFPQTIALQAVADYQEYLALKKEVDKDIGK